MIRQKLQDIIDDKIKSIKRPSIKKYSKDLIEGILQYNKIANNLNNDTAKQTSYKKYLI